MTIRKTLFVSCALLLTLPLVARLTDAASGKLPEAISMYERGLFKQAVGLLRHEAKAFPDDAKIRFWLGKAYLKVQDWKAAVSEMEKAVKLEPLNAQYHHWLGRASGERADRAFITTAYSMAKQVVRELETARRLLPEDISIRFDLLEYYLQAPGMLGGGRDKAEAEARAIAEIDRRKGHAAWANIYKKDKKWDKAKAELLQAAEEFPESAASYEDLADYLFWRNDYEGTLQWSRKALTLNPLLNYSRFLAAAAATRLNRDPETAAGELQMLTNGPLSDDDPTFDQVYCHLGENYLARGDKEKAKDAFQSALSYNPENLAAEEALKKLQKE